MPESMFGRPLQHLLPSQPQATSTGPSDSHTAPVQLAPPTFRDFRFNSIGKQPELLSRISLPQPDAAEYHSPTPSPMPTPPPTFINDLQSSRPTLLQQLAGKDFSSVEEDFRWNPSTGQSNSSLASRIQMSSSPSDDIANTHGSASRLPSPPLRVSTVRHATKDANLIPPVEVLPPLPDSSPPTPASWAPTVESGGVHSAFSISLVNATTIPMSRAPTPPTDAMDTAFKGPTEAFPSLAIPDVVMQSLPPAVASIDDLVTRQGRLQSISAKLANLAAPIPLPPSQSPPQDSSPVARVTADITPSQPSQSQYTSNPITLHHPYPTDRSSDRVGLGINDAQMHSSDYSLALVPSPMNLPQEFEIQSRAIVAAFQNLKSALNIAHRAQIDNKNALALQTRVFEEQRATFEQTKRKEETRLEREFQEFQQKREELNAKEAMLASLEKENKAREEARKVVLVKRQAQEEEKRTAEAKRVREVQEQIEAAMNELKEIEALKAKYQVEQLAIETVQDDLPTEPHGNMNDEEKTAIKSRNELLLAVKDLRRMHTDKVQRLEETNRTLRRLGVERKNREAEEVERRRADEERLRAQAQIARAVQLLDEKQRRFGAERNLQEDENSREMARLLVEQQVHAEAQAHGLGHTGATIGQSLVHPSRPEEVGASQRQGIADTTRIRAVRKENSIPPGTTDAMNVDEDGGVFRAIHSSDIRTTPGTSPVGHKKKKTKPISGGVMLAASAAKPSSGVHVPPKPHTTPSHTSSDHVVENAPNPLGAIPVSAEGGYRSSLPAQLASGINRGPGVDNRPTPDYKSAFSRTPKSQTILDATNGGSQELNIGPVAGVSPTQQNVNLRHLKRVRGRAEGNDSGDRSVRTIQVKSEENSHLSLKREEHNEQTREVAQASILSNLPTSLPPRPTIIPPPRPRMSKKRPEPASQTDPSSSYPPERNESSLKKRGAEVTTVEQLQESPPQYSLRPQTMNSPDQLPAPSDTTNSLPLGPVYAEPQVSEPRSNVGDRPALDRDENHETTPSEPVSAAPSHDMDGEDASRGNRGFSDEQRRARSTNGSRRASDRYSPPSTSTQARRLIDTWRPPNSSSGARAEPMRATSPIAGRKRPSEFSDNEYGRRARRRGDVWIAQDHDRDRVESYRPNWDRGLDSEPDDRRAAYRSPASPHDHTRPYPPDVPRAPYDNRTYAPDEPAAPPAYWEQSYRRTGNDDTYQRYPSSAPAYNVAIDQYHADDARVGQGYEPRAEERMDAQPDPSLLARMHDTQICPPRGRGRGESSRGRGDFGRGRGRGGVARGGPPLLERLTAAPASLEERLK